MYNIKWNVDIRCQSQTIALLAEEVCDCQNTRKVPTTDHGHELKKCWFLKAALAHVSPHREKKNILALHYEVISGNWFPIQRKHLLRGFLEWSQMWKGIKPHFSLVNDWAKIRELGTGWDESSREEWGNRWALAAFIQLNCTGIVQQKSRVQYSWNTQVVLQAFHMTFWGLKMLAREMI